MQVHSHAAPSCEEQSHERLLLHALFARGWCCWETRRIQRTAGGAAGDASQTRPPLRHAWQRRGCAPRPLAGPRRTPALRRARQLLEHERVSGQVGVREVELDLLRQPLRECPALARCRRGARGCLRRGGAARRRRCALGRGVRCAGRRSPSALPTRRCCTSISAADDARRGVGLRLAASTRFHRRQPFAAGCSTSRPSAGAARAHSLIGLCGRATACHSVSWRGDPVAQGGRSPAAGASPER